MPRPIRILFLGDVVGAPGRSAVQKHLPELRESLKPDAVIVNGENIRNGSGITADLYRALREAGADAVTLGDHVYKDSRIAPTIEDGSEPILRPANLSAKAPGKRLVRIPAFGERTRDIFVATVLGRVSFPMPADDPFATCDELLRTMPERNPVVVSTRACSVATSGRWWTSSWTGCPGASKSRPVTPGFPACCWRSSPRWRGRRGLSS